MRYFWALLLLFGTISLDLEEYLDDQERDPQQLFRSYTPNLEKNTPLGTLIFYTPWNKEGKGLVSKYAAKFNYVSPCWYEVNIKGADLVLQHDANYDLSFIRDVKLKNPQLKILPRVYIPGHQTAVLQAIGGNQRHLEKLISLVKKVSRLEGIDGFVWDTPYNVFSQEEQYQQVNSIIKEVINSIKGVLKPDQELFVNMDRPGNVDLRLVRKLKLDGLLIQNYASRDAPQELQHILRFIHQLDMPHVKYVALLPFFSRKNMREMISSEEARAIVQSKGIRSCRVDKMCVFDCDRANTLDIPCYNYFRGSFSELLSAGNPNLMVGFWEAGNGLEIYYSFI